MTVLALLANFILILTVYGVGCSMSDEDLESLSSLTIEHSFDSGPNPQFRPRGVINIQSVKASVAHLQEETEISTEEKSKLRRLVEEDGVYRVRIATRSPQDPSANAHYVSAFVKACSLYESRLMDTLTLHMDSHGFLIGLSVNTQTPYCVSQTVNSDTIPDQFTSSVELINTVQGPSPETQSYVEKMEKDKADKAKGQQQDNRSFFAKYWMYIVPVVLILMFANSVDPNAQGGGR